MPRSVLCCVLPLTQGTPGQVLPPDRDGIVVSSVGSCRRFPLWLRSVRLQELSTTLSEIVQRPALALVDTAFQPRALPPLAIVAARLLFVARISADVRPPVPCVGVLRGSDASARAAFRIAAPSRSRLFSKVSDAPSKSRARTPTSLRLRSSKQNVWRSSQMG